MSVSVVNKANNREMFRFSNKVNKVTFSLDVVKKINSESRQSSFILKAIRGKDGRDGSVSHVKDLRMLKS